jgi:hypothetical protein
MIRRTPRAAEACRAATSVTGLPATLIGTIRDAACADEANAGERVFVKLGEKRKDKFERAARSVSECWRGKGF